MRVPALAILIALVPTLAATCAVADEAFRVRLSEVIAEQGGCAESRALVEGELAAFERARKGDGTADEPASLVLFGKPAADWTGEDIRDLVAVIRACEAARPGQSRNPEERERRLTERMDRLAQAMRRAVVLSTRPPEVEETSANPALRADALSEARGAGTETARRTGRHGPGPAFVPLDGSRAAPVPGATADSERRPPARGAAHAPAAVPPAAPRSEPSSEPSSESPSAPTASAAPTRREAPRAAFAPGAALSTEPAFRPGAAPVEPPPQTCLVTRDRFERIRTGMSLKEVEGLFGCRGRLDSAAAIDGLGTFEVYVWSPPSQSGSVTVTFQNRRLTTKALRGMS